MNPPTSAFFRPIEEQYRVTLASIGDAVISTDAMGRITFINPVAESLTGWNQGLAIGRPLAEVFKIINEFTRQPTENPVGVVLRDGSVVGLANHTLLITRSGAEIPIDDSAAPVRDSNGMIIGVVLVFRDVTERRRAELSSLRLASIIEHSVDAIVGKDLDGVVTSWNKAAERIFGYTSEEMVGQPIIRLIPVDRKEEEPAILTRLRAGEIVEPFDTVRIRKDGGPVHVRLSISPIKDHEGRIIGASKIARDITQSREAQQRLMVMQAELEKRVEERTADLQAKIAELEAFSYSLSHDMRAPLRAITSFTEIVLADHGDKLDARSTGHLRHVISASLRMDRLIQDVLAFSHLSSRPIEIGPVDVERLIDELIAERPELQSPRAEITLHRPLAGMRGHVALLTQSIGNLLDNAVKFVAHGVIPRVNIRTEILPEQGVRLWIEDNGIGISRDAQRRLFMLFQRLNPAGSYEGMGVGLAIVRKSAERMHAQVGVESEPGQGSRFWLQLPKANP